MNDAVIETTASLPASGDLLPGLGRRRVLDPKSYAAFISEAPLRDEAAAFDQAGEAALGSMPDGIEGYSVDALARPSSSGSTTVLLRLCPRTRLVEAAKGSRRPVTTLEDWLVGAEAGVYLFVSSSLCLGFRVLDGFPRERIMVLAASAEAEAVALTALRADPADSPARIALESGAAGRPLAEFVASRPARYPLYPEAGRRLRARRRLAASAIGIVLLSSALIAAARTEAVYKARIARLGQLLAACEAEALLLSPSGDAEPGGRAEAERAARSLRAGLSALFAALGADDRLRSLSLSQGGFKLEGFLKDPLASARRLEATGLFSRVSVSGSGRGSEGEIPFSLVGSAVPRE
ncbi:MAG: hypothetical protein JNG85_02050 [Spirochaetaceae bacterium]|nr:hypothetical protein [Spirochaetaceae bacterium]